MIGDRIRIRRQELGMTQEELARRMGYKSKSTVNKVESGKNDVNQSTAVKYAMALNTTVAYLMGWEEQDSRLGKEMMKRRMLDEIYDYCDGELPTLEELDKIMAIRRLSAYDKKLTDMILTRETDGEPK